MKNKNSKKNWHKEIIKGITKAVQEDEKDIESDIIIEELKTTKLGRIISEGEGKGEIDRDLRYFFLRIKTMELNFFRIHTCCFQF